MSGPLVIGVTGGIGSGKSAVCEAFQKHGVTVIDADIVAREVVVPGSAGLEEIRAQFGAEVLHEDGTLNREKLRNIVFADDTQRALLESILHPKIRARIEQQINAAGGVYCLLCVPLLLEKGGAYRVDRLLVVDCPEEIQIERVKNRDKSTTEQIQAIIASQASRDQRLAAADDVIENTGTVEQLKDRVDSLHAFYLELANLPAE